jgi:hypothetical protein
MEKYSYDYYWYDHLQRSNMPTIIKAIEESIKSKDFNSFMFFYNKQKELFITLPSNISVYDQEQEEIIEHLDVTIKENFDKITFNEYECG